MTIKPLHTAEDAAKIDAIAESMRANGWVGNPILVDDEDSNEPQAFTGSHRIAAAEIAGIEVEVYSLADSGIDIGALMFDCLDDDDRLELIEESDDEEATRIMREEIESNA